MRPLSLAVTLLLAGGLAAQEPLRGPLAPLERSYQQLRYWDDQVRLTLSLGSDRTVDGLPALEARDSLRGRGDAFRRLLEQVSDQRLDGDDRRALRTMRGAVQAGLGLPPPLEPVTNSVRPTSCATAPDSAAETRQALSQLTAWVMVCFGRAASHVVVGNDTLNRLAILGLLARAENGARRRELFLGLEPVWRSVNGDNGPASPYRALVRLRRAAWGDSASPIDRKGPAFGLATPELERWLVRALEGWRRALPDSLLEPWDWFHATGEASRRLSPRLESLATMLRVNREFYRAMGADPESLRIRYDLATRPGKYPVAFTDMGSRNRWAADGRLLPGQPWVFTNYLHGSFDNLTELLHETGHAVHVAAIRARPAYVDWPDSDTFTEALADVPALEIFEPDRQWRLLGDSVGLHASLRAKYASVVMDMAWALFEIRVHRTPAADPNQIWAELTSTFLGIRPHPEWSWWAMRGQLVDARGT